MRTLGNLFITLTVLYYVGLGYLFITAKPKVEYFKIIPTPKEEMDVWLDTLTIKKNKHGKLK